MGVHATRAVAKLELLYMKVRRGASRVLWYESIGFGLILLLAWLNKAVDLPELLLGTDAAASKWRDGFIETILILLIWAFVISLTKRLVEQLHYLEGLLRICAWCRKVGHGEKWMKLEDYFAEGFHIGTTHGVCPECLKKLEDDTKEFYKNESCPTPLQLAEHKPAPASSDLAA
jgi:hypothetical protein